MKTTEELREYQRLWRSKNKDRIAVYNRRQRKLRRDYKKRLREQNPELNSKLIKEWFTKNPGKRNEYRAAYNARKKKLTVPLSEEEKLKVAAVYKAAREKTIQTGVRHHVDHIVPLAKGGLHHPDNLQVLTAQQNQRKSAK